MKEKLLLCWSDKGVAVERFGDLNAWMDWKNYSEDGAVARTSHDPVWRAMSWEEAKEALCAVREAHGGGLTFDQLVKGYPIDIVPYRMDDRPDDLYLVHTLLGAAPAVWRSEGWHFVRDHDYAPDVEDETCFARYYHRIPDADLSNRIVPLKVLQGAEPRATHVQYGLERLETHAKASLGMVANVKETVVVRVHAWNERRWTLEEADGMLLLTPVGDTVQVVPIEPKTRSTCTVDAKPVAQDDPVQEMLHRVDAVVSRLEPVTAMLNRPIGPEGAAAFEALAARLQMMLDAPPKEPEKPTLLDLHHIPDRNTFIEALEDRMRRRMDAELERRTKELEEREARLYRAEEAQVREEHRQRKAMLKAQLEEEDRRTELEEQLQNVRADRGLLGRMQQDLMEDRTAVETWAKEVDERAKAVKAEHAFLLEAQLLVQAREAAADARMAEAEALLTEAARMKLKSKALKSAPEPKPKPESKPDDEPEVTVRRCGNTTTTIFHQHPSKPSAPDLMFYGGPQECGRIKSPCTKPGRVMAP